MLFPGVIFMYFSFKQHTLQIKVAGLSLTPLLTGGVNMVISFLYYMHTQLSDFSFALYIVHTALGNARALPFSPIYSVRSFYL